ncbi:MAG: pyridoxine 5'-phosphate synthase [Calditrichaeota bacterium]|nr:MAG: pyridoxine 5'-phosphate synthase [Calditrichota bacterium]
MARLCLCLNQIARIRNQKRGKNPDPVTAAIAAEMAGVDGIVIQLRDDRSDITDRDVTLLKEVVQSHLNIALPANDDMIKKAINWSPDMVTLLPSTFEQGEGSLDAASEFDYLVEIVQTLRGNNIVVTLLIDPDPQQIRAAARAQVDYVQFNTSILSSVDDLGAMSDTVELIRSAAITANKIGLGISAGRGLTNQSLRELSDIEFIEEFNVGWSIVSRALLIGMDKAVRDIKSLLES